MMRTKIAGIVVAGLLTMAAPRAFGQGHELHYAHAGALLAYSQSEINLLYASLLQKEFDPRFTKDTIDELTRTFVAAKRRVDRTIALLPDKLGKHGPALEKLREAIYKCETNLAKLANDIEEQTGGLQEEEDEPELGTRADELPEEEPPQRDWALLKRGTQWLGKDLKDARQAYARLAKGLKLRSVRNPPAPRGKRPE